jgi:hypothetical protein
MGHRQAVAPNSQMASGFTLPDESAKVGPSAERISSLTLETELGPPSPAGHSYSYFGAIGFALRTEPVALGFGLPAAARANRSARSRAIFSDTPDASAWYSSHAARPSVSCKRLRCAMRSLSIVMTHK